MWVCIPGHTQKLVRILLKSVKFPTLPTKAYLVFWNSQDSYNKTKRYPNIPNQAKPTNFKSTEIGFVEKRLDQNQSMLKGDTKKIGIFSDCFCVFKNIYVAIQLVSVTSLVMSKRATHLVHWPATSMANFWSSNLRIAMDSFGKPSKQTNLGVSKKLPQPWLLNRWEKGPLCQTRW